VVWIRDVCSGYENFSTPDPDPTSKEGCKLKFTLLLTVSGASLIVAQFHKDNRPRVLKIK
jgi:hypothetical protein